MSSASEESPATKEKSIIVHYVRPDFQLSPDLIAVIQKAPNGIYSLDAEEVEALIPNKIIVKSRLSETRQWLEGQSMLFVSERTSLPVPTVFAVLSDGPLTTKSEDYPYRIYILMELLPGDTLDELWSRCGDDEEAKRILSDRISKELKECLQQLRAIEHKAGYIGAIDGGPVQDTKFSEVPNRGPFATEADFNTGIQDAFISTIKATPEHNVPIHLDRMLSPYTPHAITFTHGDLHFSNILIGGDGHISGIIDWEYAGWYPDYWEYTCTFYHTKHQDPQYKMFVNEAIGRPHEDIAKAVNWLHKVLICY